MRVTWLTDVHLNFLDEQRLDEFLGTVAHEHPDLLLITGDTAESADVIEAIDRLTSIAPVYFVLGNHDYYRSSIVEVRDRASATHRWLPSVGPVRLTDATALVGVDGWGDARCGDLGSKVVLADWRFIHELSGLTAAARIDTLRALGTQEAEALRDQFTRLAPARELIVLTHVPPFPEACWYNGKRSSPEWLPWFSCIAVGEVLLEHARRSPDTRITVLCGHTHGRGEYRAADNLLVRTGGWPPGKTEYGNPLVQASWALA